MKISKRAAWRLLIRGIEHPETTMYVMHCRYVGDLACRIASALGYDGDFAAGLGYLHDIGRKIDSPNHVYAGWKYLTELGLDEYAAVCMTHSFLENDIECTCARAPQPTDLGYDTIKEFLKNHQNSFYDRLIQLCDLLCMHTGPVSLAERIADIERRKGTHAKSAYHRACAEKLLADMDGKLQLEAGTMVWCQYESVKNDYRILPERVLVAVDLQADFVDGALGSPAAVAAARRAAEKIAGFEGKVFATFDTHGADYMFTAEGLNLPVPHCVQGTPGWAAWGPVAEALNAKGYTLVKKSTFGSVSLPDAIRREAGHDDIEIEVIGLCTDICVVSNALLLKAAFPEVNVRVDSACCAGVTPEKHEAALETMRSCQIDVY